MGTSNASSNQKAGLGSFVLLNQIPEEKSETVEWQITSNHRILLMYSDVLGCTFYVLGSQMMSFFRTLKYIDWLVVL